MNQLRERSASARHRDPEQHDDRLPDDVLRCPEEPRHPLGNAAEGVRAERAVVRSCGGCLGGEPTKRLG
jgi:hypothetical protein